MKKGLKLEPYRESKLQTFTVDIFCHQGERMHSPVKRIKGCWMTQEGQNYTILTANNKQLKCYDDNPTAGLVFASVVLQTDGIWVYGMEHIGWTKTYYQVWHLLPEPNEFTENKDAKKRSNRSGGSS